MDPINHLNPIEQNLCNKADLAGIPIAGNIELLPLCNMDCKMCFAKMTRSQMEAHSPMHTYQEWLDIAGQASEAGTMFMLLTGGEPFLYPDLEKLYYGMKRMGYVLSINTNGTLIDAETADWLAEDPPRRLNITLYGSSDETYRNLCGNPHGFSQVMNAVDQLKKRDISIKFNCSLTPYNIHDLEDIYRLSQELEIPIDIGYYMFPPVRSNNIGNVQYRLTAREAAKARYRIEELRYGAAFDDYVAYSLKKYREYEQTEPYKAGYTCRSGNSVYWINYDGTLSACSFTMDCLVNVFDRGFKTAWDTVYTHVKNSLMPLECHNCKMRILCGYCAASAISENGSIHKVPRYYCDLTRYYIELLDAKEKQK